MFVFLITQIRLLFRPLEYSEVIVKKVELAELVPARNIGYRGCGVAG